MESDNKTKIKKKIFYKSQKNGLTTPLSGFIITCDNHKEKNAINDAYNILNEYTDKIYPHLSEKYDASPTKKIKKDNETQNQNNILASKLLDDELNELKEKNERFFYTHDIGIKKGIVFIKINPKYSEISPYALCDAIMSTVHEKNIEVSRFIHKLIPVEKAFNADFESFKSYIQEIILRNFPTGPEQHGKSWFLDFKSRNNSKYKQKEFLEFILGIIGKSNFVSYKEPEITLFVEINQSIMCISALKNFFVYKKYSLHTKNLANNSKVPTISPKVPKENKEKAISPQGNLENDRENEEKPSKIIDNNSKENDEEEEEIKLL